MWGDSRLNLVLDAPDPNRITRGLYSVARNPESLTKEFFSYRKNYGDLSDPRFKEGVLSACSKLLNEEWPSYFFPVFPWMTAAQVETQLPQGATGKSVLTNLDQILLDKFEQEDDGVPREHRWMAERGLYRPWLKSQSLTDPVVLLRSDHRTNLHPYFSSRLASAQGLLHSPARSKGIAWWTPRVAMALAQHTPVFTAWRESQFLGPSWAVFPRTFEVLSEKERVDVATEQYNTYVPAINDVATCAANLLDSLELEKTA